MVRGVPSGDEGTGALCRANGNRDALPSRSLATSLHAILFSMKTNRNTRGVLLALIGGTGWGFSGACSQYLFAQNVDPLWASAVAMTVAGAALMLYVAMRRRKSLRALLSNRRSVARLILFSLVGLMLCRVTYLLAIQYSNAGTATVLQYVGPVLIVVASCFSKHRPPSAKEAVAVACVALGTYLLATHGNPSTMALSFEGVFWGLSAAVAVAIYSLLPGSLMKEYGSVSVVACGLLLGGVVLYLGAGCWNRAPDLDIAGLLAMYGGLTGVGTLVGFDGHQRHRRPSRKSSGKRRDGFGDAVCILLVAYRIRRDGRDRVRAYHGHGLSFGEERRCKPREKSHSRGRRGLAGRERKFLMMQPPRIAGGILATVLAAALFFVVVGICALFQGGVMSYLGFEYESVGAFFLFFFLGYLICTPFDFIVEAIPVALFKIGVLKNEGGVGFYVLHTAADAFFTAGCLAVVDAFMDSVSASWAALAASSLALAVVDSWIDYRFMKRMAGLREEWS